MLGELLANNKAFVLKILTAVLGTFFGWINHKYALGLDPMAIAGVTASVIMGIAIHAAAKDHGVNRDAAQTDTKPDDPSSVVAATTAKLLLIGFLFLGLGGCKVLDAKMVKTFQDREAKLMQQLGVYLDGDQKSGAKTADQVTREKTKIAAHLLQVQQSLTAVPAADEEGLMSELLSYVNADPRRDADSKADKDDSVQAHLRLFHDLIR